MDVNPLLPFAILSIMTERQFAQEIVRRLQEAGFVAYWAGGCVRDELLGLVPADYDVATNARPEQLRPLFKHRNEIGASFGVVQVIGPRGDDGKWLTVEVATFRSDTSYTDGRRPDAVIFSSPEEDAKRRDFTINGMFFNPATDDLIDCVGGRADLEARLLRAIGDPAARFTEDKLRILRAVRIAARFELAIEPATLAAAQRMAREIGVVSPERIAEELRKLLADLHRARGVALLREFHLLEPILPEITATAPDIPEQRVRIEENLPAGASFPLAFAALLYDLDRTSVEQIADRLRLSGAEKSHIVSLVVSHKKLADAPAMRLSQLKPILAQAWSDELLALGRAVALSTGMGLASIEFCERILRETLPEELNPPPLLTGEDLISLGLKPGPEFKRLLDVVRDAQLDGEMSSKAEAMELVRRLRSRPSPDPDIQP